MQRVYLTNEVKVLDELTCRRKSLRSYTSASLSKVVKLDIRHKPLK